VACLGTRTRSLKVFGKLISMNIPETVKIGMVYGLVIFIVIILTCFACLLAKQHTTLKQKDVISMFPVL